MLNYYIMKRQQGTNSQCHKRHNKKRRMVGNELAKILEMHNSDSGSDCESGDYYDSENVTCKDNRIYFKTNVTDDSVETLIKIIDSKNRSFHKLMNGPMVTYAEPKPIYLHITSYGGSMLAGFRALDAIERSEIPIYTVVDGYAASAATMMSIVGKKRYMTPRSYMLIHQLSSWASGKYWELKDEYKNCKAWMDDIYKIYLNHSTMSREELEQQLSHDTWWRASECMAKGLIDEIYGHSNYTREDEVMQPNDRDSSSSDSGDNDINVPNFLKALLENDKKPITTIHSQPDDDTEDDNGIDIEHTDNEEDIDV